MATIIKTPPPIGSSFEISKAFGDHKGKPCLVLLKVKYKLEKDWVFHRIWMTPGWEQGDIWRSAYTWMKRDGALLYYDQYDIEEAKFDSFSLV